MKTKQIFIKKLEKIHTALFNKKRYRPILKEVIAKTPGIYALYDNKNTLYYIGRTDNLLRRLSQHLEDQHSGKWDKFSIYFTQNKTTLKNLEDAFISIARPQGNRSQPKRIPDIKKIIEKKMIEIDEDQRRSVLSPSSSKWRKNSLSLLSYKSTKQALANKQNPFGRAIDLIAHYKGTTYKAKWLSNGTLKYKDQVYKSLSGMGKAVTKNIPCAGKRLWKTQDVNGKLVSIGLLLKNQKTPSLLSYKSTKQALANKQNPFGRAIDLIAHYKGTTYKAKWLSNGTLKYKDQVYKSLSGMGKAVTKNIPCAGKRLWKTQDVNGKLVSIGLLLKNQKTPSLLDKTRNLPVIYKPSIKIGG